MNRLARYQGGYHKSTINLHLGDGAHQTNLSDSAEEVIPGAAPRGISLLEQYILGSNRHIEVVTFRGRGDCPDSDPADIERNQTFGSINDPAGDHRLDTDNCRHILIGRPVKNVFGIPHLLNGSLRDDRQLVAQRERLYWIVGDIKRRKIELPEETSQFAT